MERRGRIPVATYRTPEGKTRSRSRVRDPNYNKSDPDTDLFTLLEDNIALREENELLIVKNTTFEGDKQEMEKENSELKNRIKDLIGQHESLKSQIIEINLTLNKTIEEKMVIKASQQQQADKIKRLTKQLDELKNSQTDYSEIIETNKMLKEEIYKLVPATNTNEFESLIETHKDTSHLIAIECIQKLITEFTQLKTNLNNAELHLYEANEKISELLENQTHLEGEIEHLRVENTKLTRVAELMTTNMKESVNTSKKMEEALIEMKRRNDELAKRTLDSLDGGGGTPTPNAANEEIVRLRDEINRRDLAHGERIVEMKKLMDRSIENTSNDEIKLLRLKVEIIEKELRDAVERAERAETKLQDYETNSSKYGSLIKVNGGGEGGGGENGGGLNGVCDECYQSSSSLNRHETTATTTASISLSAPPPPPPPMPKLNFPSPNASMKNLKGARSLNDSISSHNLKDGNMLRKQQVESTGLDALVKELKDGNVTLRRARRRTQTNAALKELFDVLEVSRTQNRNSKLLIENHMTEVHFTLSKF